ncbi:bifunctional 2-C-methyl-D-erythritol 4-phosphate cytidylyltransferase/2-C-methyl-D-erythritol 2,4-cyclodiphosphate synthase [Sphingorhabdus arenilitoris]|uniref:Bifunctional enzyme IspD/IspF n=1 Tax=Sphingorhabdus arenilitoris TaxID=1490041 RepID=A0ABV8RFE7_9SPHN
MSEQKDIAAIIVAAGIGSRAGGDIPKQYRSIGGKPMLRHSYEIFASHSAIDRIIVVIGGGQEEQARLALEGLPPPIIVTGGDTRRDSVHQGLKYLSQSAPGQVLIHDAARPFLTFSVIDNLLSALTTHSGAVPVLPVVDSLARGHFAGDHEVMAGTVPREDLWRVQTPQAFHFAPIYDAHQNWDVSQEATDDARMAMAAGHDVALVPGEEALSKYTFAQDFGDESMDDNIMPPIRCGTGFDVHKLVKDEELWLCGVRIDHSHGLSGHSDADVALHAVTDAILGAMALGDIGDHFPPSDERWRGASSDQFAAHAMQLARQEGYALANADVTIICEAPKIGRHRTAMREKLAAILGVDVAAISVKATTTERLGFTGREEGIASQAVATLYKAG